MQNKELIEWFLNEAIPTWETKGVDLINGGFHEELNQTGHVDLPRRTRVICRQIYVFYIGSKLGYRNEILDLVDHGADFLFNKLFITNKFYCGYSYDINKEKLNKDIYLYEQTFVLLALAIIYKVSKKYKDISLELSQKILSQIKLDWGTNLKEIMHSSTHSKVILTDPYMHLFESIMVWEEFIRKDRNIKTLEVFTKISSEIVTLVKELFFDNQTKFILEKISFKNKSLKEKNCKQIVPGHQYEWGYLLILWGLKNESVETINLGKHLIEKIEEVGLDRNRNAVINELGINNIITDNNAKFWPQTERLKAWGLLVKYNDRIKIRLNPNDNLELSIKGLKRYLESPIRGCWREVLSDSGRWEEGNVKASSLYHIASAIDMLNKI
tara:strand:+ start:3538 stop:4689 length:1152 start_codon:yes stop_codon:yes gene_type:complete